MCVVEQNGGMLTAGGNDSGVVVEEWSSAMARGIGAVAIFLIGFVHGITDSMAGASPHWCVGYGMAALISGALSGGGPSLVV